MVAGKKLHGFLPPSALALQPPTRWVPQRSGQPSIPSPGGCSHLFYFYFQARVKSNLKWQVLYEMEFPSSAQLK